MNVISVLLKENPSLPSPLPSHEDTVRKPGTELSPERDPAGSLILEFPTSRTVRIKFSLFMCYVVTGFCDSSLNRIRHISNFIRLC